MQNPARSIWVSKCLQSSNKMRPHAYMSLFGPKSPMQAFIAGPVIKDEGAVGGVGQKPRVKGTNTCQYPVCLSSSLPPQLLCVALHPHLPLLHSSSSFVGVSVLPPAPYSLLQDCDGIRSFFPSTLRWVAPVTALLASPRSPILTCGVS